MDALGLEWGVLVGESAGGLVAVQAALAAPERVSALVLVGAAGLDRQVGLVYRLLSLPLLGEALSRPTLALGRAALQSILWDHHYITDAFVERWLRRRRAPGGNRAFLRILRVGVDIGGIKRAFVLAPRLSALSQPVLLIWGAQNRVVLLSAGQRAKKLLPRADLLILDRCGHWLHVERRHEFNEAVLSFVLAHAGRPREMGQEAKEAPEWL